MAMPNLGGYAQRRSRRHAGDPVHLRRSQARAFELRAGAHDNGLFRGAQLQDVHRFGSGNAEPFTLSDRKAVHAPVAPENLARLAHNRTTAVEIAGLALDERGVIAIGHEADLLAVG